MITLFEIHKIKKSQREVDFLIPFLDIDRRFCLDPELLRNTTTKYLIPWKTEVEDFIQLINRIIRKGDYKKIESLLNIGEAPDAGLGYCDKGVSGSGFGDEISKNIIKILSTNPDFKKRGLERLEELQWFDKDIGPDRISDLVIHILKRHIIKYTKNWSRKCGVPLEDVRINKVFEPNSLSWVSIKDKLPINPKRVVRDALNPHPPLLFLPKEIIKPLPLFLNYDDFYGFIDPEYIPGESLRMSKAEVVKDVIKNPIKSSQYIRNKETKLQTLYRPDFDSDIHKKLVQLEHIPVGSRAHANEYRDLVKDLLEFLFDDLEFFKKEKSTILKDNRRDIIFVNNGTSGVFDQFKTKHSATTIIVDAKNTDKVTTKDVAQVSGYLNEDATMVGFIVSRKKHKLYKNYSYTQLTKHKKILLFISDQDLKRWVTYKTRIQHMTNEKTSEGGPVKGLTNMYLDIITD